MVRNSAEFQRIRSLPRREWASYGKALSDQITPLLARPGGTMRLFPQQAVALQEIHQLQGGAIALGVGEGKTLISLLAPYVLGSQRPLLVLPANLIDKTKRDQRELARDWLIPSHLKMISYEWLGRTGAKDELAHYQPDLVILDEAQMAKNAKGSRASACAIRLMLYAQERRSKRASFRAVVMSGTFTTSSYKEFSHLFWMALMGLSPVPLSHMDLEEWCSALDEDGVADWERVQPGVLEWFLAAGVPATLENVRKACGLRIVQTPGVVASLNERLGVPLLVRAWPVVESTGRTPTRLTERVRTINDSGTVHKPLRLCGRAIDDALELLIRKWELPDGRELFDGKDVWRHANEILLGFYYVWEPPPPREWVEARREWGRFVRSKRGSKYHSTLDVANHFPDEETLVHWQEVRDTYDPEKCKAPVWLCDSVVDACTEWMHKNRHGIVWTRHIAFAERLATKSGLPYFGRKGLDANGVYIEDASGPIIASVKSNYKGRNLQKKWHTALCPSFPSSGEIAEQMIGRMHRTGQRASQVVIDVYVGGAEHLAAFWAAHRKAQFQASTLQQQFRLMYCDLDMPPLVSQVSGPRWDRD